LFGQPGAQGIGLRSPGGQSLRLEEVEQSTGTLARIAAVGEVDDLAGAFV
jgi:hypothetical protein